MLKVKINWSLLTELCQEEVEDFVPARQGVYLLMVKRGSGGWRCFYVNHTENLRKTLFDFAIAKSAFQKINKVVSDYFCSFVYAECDEKLSLDIVKYLNATYRPELSFTETLGEELLIEVNLPGTPIKLATTGI